MTEEKLEYVYKTDQLLLRRLCIQYEAHALVA
jgi:hypothetical protein